MVKYELLTGVRPPSWCHSPTFEGTFRFASDEALDAAITKAQRTPKPEDDLEPFLRVVFAMADRLLWSTLAGVKDGDFAVVKQLWQNFKEENTRHVHMFNAGL